VLQEAKCVRKGMGNNQMCRSADAAKGKRPINLRILNVDVWVKDGCADKNYHWSLIDC